MVRFWKKESFIPGLLILLALCGVTSLGYAETDVTAKVQMVQSRLMFDIATSTSYLEVSVKNISQDVLLTPIKVVISGISDASVTVANANGVTADGKPYFEYTTQTGRLLAGGTIASKRVSFKNVKRVRFTYTTTVYATTPGPGTNKIPDTGQTTSYTNTFGEDSDYNINPQSYTKLDANGTALADSAGQWAMVKDNVTGLIWENKTNDGGIHDKQNRYTWYDPNPATNGGDAGTAGNGTDTKDYIDALNAANFGGFENWRLPTVMELSMLVNSNIPDTGPAINTAYFQNTMSSVYWSSTTFAGYPDYAWSVYFYYGYVSYGHKSYNLYVRAVRGGQ
jgi:hypothetical protein